MATDKLRIVLQFNTMDFRHRRALEVINRQPRHKTDLIVNAILHYITCPNAEKEFNGEYSHREAS